MMNYKEAREYIEQRPRYGGELGLDAIRILLEELDHPERSLSFIHIAGTNGKGSVLSHISTVLTYGGYRVGRYLSPTLYSYRERFQVNGSYISREDFVRLVCVRKQKEFRHLHLSSWRQSYASCISGSSSVIMWFWNADLEGCMMRQM